MSMFSSKTDTTESSAKDLDRVRLAKQKKPKRQRKRLSVRSPELCRTRFLMNTFTGSTFLR